jgi:rubredoxin
LATVSAAASLGNVLYGDYRWLFRLIALISVALGLLAYFRRSGICSLESARRERNRVINVSLMALIFSIGAYVFWTYVVLHYWGIAAGLPWAEYDEHWAIPVAGALFSGAALLAYAMRRMRQAPAPTVVNPAKSRAASSNHTGRHAKPESAWDHGQ